MTAAEILMPASMHASVLKTLDRRLVVHRLWKQPDAEAFYVVEGSRIRGLAIARKWLKSI